MNLETNSQILPPNHVSYYEILGVPKESTLKEVKTAYHSLLLNNHPDKQTQLNLKLGQQRHQIQHIQDAYKTLSDEKKRKEYDIALHHHFIKLGLNSTNTSINIDGIDRIDLSEFEVVEDREDEGEEELFIHACPRCTFEDGFVLSESDLEQGTQKIHNDNDYNNEKETDYQLLVQCASCSLWICVTYSIS